MLVQLSTDKRSGRLKATILYTKLPLFSDDIIVLQSNSTTLDIAVAKMFNLLRGCMNNECKLEGFYVLYFCTSEGLIRQPGTMKMK